MKHEDIPQDIWDAASVLVPDYVKRTIVEGIARAILNERNNAAKIISELIEALKAIEEYSDDQLAKNTAHNALFELPKPFATEASKE